MCHERSKHFQWKYVFYLLQRKFCVRYVLAYGTGIQVTIMMHNTLRWFKDMFALENTFH